ncbi:MAG: ABC transporter ATP-binding protein [Desulfobacteraceae bacterium]|nr:MAG: ABC transporter ATP-binding protein [Desulfobacteraceae bacterium]
MLEVKNLEVVYSDVIRVIRSISFSVPANSIVALLGANGAGKSTILKAVSNILSLEDGQIMGGTIHFHNVPVRDMSPEKIVKLGIVQVPEGRGLFDDLTAAENLRIGSYVRSDRSAVRKDMEAVFAYFPILRERRSQPAGYLSGGERQMLAISRAFMGECRLLMLDEPSLGLAPQVTREIFRIIAEISRDKGTSILLVEQNARMALSLAAYGYVMENGKIVLDGTSEKLLTNDDVKEFYLGLTEVGVQKSYRNVKHYRRRKRWLS